MNETPRIFSLHGVRYQVTDVARAAAFYTDRLGFKLEHHSSRADGIESSCASRICHRGSTR